MGGEIYFVNAVILIAILAVAPIIVFIITTARDYYKRK